MEWARVLEMHATNGSLDQIVWPMLTKKTLKDGQYLLLSQMKPITLTLRVFINDVNLLIGQHPGMTNDKFYTSAQKDINSWHGILKVTQRQTEQRNVFGPITTSNMIPKEIL